MQTELQTIDFTPQAAASETALKLRSVLESAGDAIVTTDETGRIRSWNRAAVELFGYRADEAVGQPLELIVPERYHATHRDGLQRALHADPEREAGKVTELTALRKDGSEVPIELSLGSWTAGGKRYFTGMIRDISERKRHEAQLRDYAEELARTQSQLVEAETQAMVGRLVAGLLHEVNTPLAALRSAADLVGRALSRCETADADDDRRSLRAVEDLGRVVAESAGRIADVVDNLGRFVGLDSSEAQRRDLREGLRGALSLLRAEGQAVSIREQIAATATEVHGDHRRLNQALLALLRNAIEASALGGEITVALERNGDRAVVVIADRGRGMSPEELTAACEPGFSSKQGRVRLRLGLASSKRAIEQAGGTLTLESQAGKGTRATVTLPLAA